MTRARIHHLLDIALFVWGSATAASLVTSGIADARQSVPWPRSLDLAFAVAVVIAVPALLAAGWAKRRLRTLGAVLDDERTAVTHLRSLAAALGGTLAAQLPFFFHVELPAAAQAKLTVAAALVCYGAARLWLNREA
jgi:hypothetical protein